MGCKTIESWATGSQAVGCFGMNGDCRPISQTTELVLRYQPKSSMTCRGCGFAVCLKRCRNPFSLRRCFSVWRTVIERGAHDFQFRVLIVHRGLYVAMTHRSHYRGKVPGSHQNPRTVVMSRTVENEFFRKACSSASFSKEIAD
jgi:hypothetical protein